MQRIAGLAWNTAAKLSCARRSSRSTSSFRFVKALSHETGANRFPRMSSRRLWGPQGAILTIFWGVGLIRYIAEDCFGGSSNQLKFLASIFAGRVRSRAPMVPDDSLEIGSWQRMSTPSFTFPERNHSFQRMTGGPDSAQGRL